MNGAVPPSSRIRVDVVNVQRALRLNRPAVAAWIRTLMARIPPPDPHGAWTGVSVLVGDDAALREANRRTFGRDRPTDVISIAYPPGFGDDGWTGDLVVNAQRARDEGARRPGGPARELALYLAHGCDHLSGAEDATPAGRSRMRRRENTWLRTAPAGALRALILPPSRRRTPA